MKIVHAAALVAINIIFSWFDWYVNVCQGLRQVTVFRNVLQYQAEGSTRAKINEVDSLSITMYASGFYFTGSLLLVQVQEIR